MSETGEPKPAQTMSATGQDGLTAGAMLRQAREAAGLHVAALAVSMKVSVKKLEALEADRFDLLPDAVFARALASSICRTLKVNPAAVLEKLPHGPAPRLVTDESRINTPFQPHGPNFGNPLTGYFAKPAAVVVALLLLVTVAIVVYPKSGSSDAASEPNAVESESAASAGVPLGGPVVPDAAQVPPSTVTTTTPVPLAAPGTATAVAAPVSAPLPGPRPGSPDSSTKLPEDKPASVTKPVGVEAKSVPAAPLVAASAPATGPALLTFKTRGESWVQATDAKGQVLLNRTLTAGESVAVQGATPIAVVIGRVDSTQVEVRGSPFNLGAITKDNVARFEVK
ncbi:MAG: helix-turn-helix domain-containing protein [Rhodoferax sp.]|nr:helix-turn-helix domain-containing protein [Rhodoferax sp.]